MQQIVDAFLTKIGAPKDFLEEEGEVGFIVDKEVFTIIALGDMFLLESVVLPVPFSPLAKQKVIHEILMHTAPFCMIFPFTVALSPSLDDFLMQITLEENAKDLKSAKDLMRLILHMTKALEWWREKMNKFLDKPSSPQNLKDTGKNNGLPLVQQWA